MDVELKKKWVAALRSGDYKQTQGSLGKLADDRLVQFLNPPTPLDEIDSFCCLGVLRMIEKPEGPFYYPEVKYDDHGPYNLVTLNDQKKWNFNEIADYIEEFIS